MLCEKVFTLRGFSIVSGSTPYAFGACERRKLTAGTGTGGETTIGGGFGLREDVRGGKIAVLAGALIDPEPSELLAMSLRYFSWRACSCSRS